MSIAALIGITALQDGYTHPLMDHQAVVYPWVLEQVFGDRIAAILASYQLRIMGKAAITWEPLHWSVEFLPLYSYVGRQQFNQTCSYSHADMENKIYQLGIVFQFSCIESPKWLASQGRMMRSDQNSTKNRQSERPSIILHSGHDRNRRPSTTGSNFRYCCSVIFSGSSSSSSIESLCKRVIIR